MGAVSASDLVVLSITPEKCSTANGEHAAAMFHSLPDTGADLDAILELLYMLKFSGVSLRKGIQPVTAVGSPIVSIGVPIDDRSTQSIPADGKFPARGHERLPSSVSAFVAETESRAGRS